MFSKEMVKFGAGGFSFAAIVELVMKLSTGGQWDWMNLVAVVVPAVISLVMQFLPSATQNALAKVKRAIDDGVLPEGKAIVERIGKDGLPDAFALKAQWGNTPVVKVDAGAFVE